MRRGKDKNLDAQAMFPDFGETAVERSSENERLTVIEDLDNGYEYYVTPIDVFEFDGCRYAAMTSYEPDDGEHRTPDFILMRTFTRKDRKGREERCFRSIRSRAELDACFARFMERLEAGNVADPDGF